MDWFALFQISRPTSAGTLEHVEIPALMGTGQAQVDRTHQLLLLHRLRLVMMATRTQPESVMNILV